MSIYFNKKKIYLNTNQTIALVFLLIIIAGSILLLLPISYKDVTDCNCMTALFTSTSAVCVTGLSLVDVYSTFSIFGQLIILILMETGGLGFMSIVSIMFHITKHNKSIETLSLMAESIGSDGLNSVSRIQKRLLIGSFIFEITGATVLFLAFLPYYSLPSALWFAIFHSVSAFCNAGFDLMGITSKGAGLSVFNDNPVVLITVAMLIIIGGLGFIVWDDIATCRHMREWSVYTKLVLVITPILVASGTILFLLFEMNNSFVGMNFSEMITNAFFQSVTPRTAGFASVSQDSLSDRSVALTIILMVIGGSAGSTAGGIKTVTFAILLKTILSSIKGEKRVILFHRTISIEQISQAYTVATSFILLSILGGFIISITSDTSLTNGIFESTSALATVGLSLGITGSLSLISKIIVVILMYIGRVGLLTLTLGFFGHNDSNTIKYPSAKLLIG